jgi:hypothetical protein
MGVGFMTGDKEYKWEWSGKGSGSGHGSGKGHHLLIKQLCSCQPPPQHRQSTQTPTARIHTGTTQAPTCTTGLISTDVKPVSAATKI